MNQEENTKKYDEYGLPIIGESWEYKEKDYIKKYMSSLGKKSAESLTVEQRKERAKKAVAKRWENHRNMIKLSSEKKLFKKER